MAKLTAEIHSYADAEKFLAGKKSRKLSNNTYVERPDYANDIVGVRLHATVIVTYHRDGRIILNTGGWNTPTTFDRLHQLTPYFIGTSRAKGDFTVMQWHMERDADREPTEWNPNPTKRVDDKKVVADTLVTIYTNPNTGEILDIFGDRT